MEDSVYKELYDDVEEFVPKYCPGCGEEFVRIGGEGLHYIWVMPYGKDVVEGEVKVSGFDCYCGHCTWSGYIEPDELN